MLGDFHTHSTLDDGKSPLADMARAAWEKGIQYFGFSGHSFDENGQDFCLSRANVPLYLETARALQAEYRGRMEILVGMELDYFGEKPQGLDYVIGSVHGIPLGNETCYVDESAQRSRRAVEEHFHGDWYAMTRAYYDLVAGLPRKTGCDVIGHFDLVTKFNEQAPSIDEEDPRYLGPALEAMEHLVKQGVLFEINTGAIARGYRTQPYPAMTLLRRLRELRGEIVLNSDSHHTSHLCCAFDQAISLAKEAGFTHTNVLTLSGRKPVGWREFQGEETR